VYELISFFRNETKCVEKFESNVGKVFEPKKQVKELLVIKNSDSQEQLKIFKDQGSNATCSSSFLFTSNNSQERNDFSEGERKEISRKTSTIGLERKRATS
jgi:hypothetical protein